MPHLVWALAVGALGGAGALVWSLMWNPVPAGREETLAPAPSTTHTPAVEDSLLETWAAGAPFRRDRRRPPVAFDARREAQGEVPEAERPPRPQLALRGILFGTQPAGILEGIPGVEGARAMRVGDRIGDLRIARITEALVEVRASDTTWVLRVERGAFGRD